MFEKNLALVPLFDLYGALLSEQKQKMFELYFFEDLSLSEISEETGISRQGVRDSIKKCEEQLLLFEEKLKMYQKAQTAERAATNLGEIHVQKSERARLDQIIADIRSLAE